jgi:predicted helicase
MRQQLMETFNEVYVLDLHGNAKKKERTPDGGPDENVFDIQQGVAIDLFVKEPGKEGLARVQHAHLWGTRETKYAWLMEHNLRDTTWSDLAPSSPFYLFAPQDVDLLAEYERGWKVTDVLPLNSVGIVTARDHLTIHWTAQEVLNTVKDFVETSPEEARKKFQLGKDVRDWKVSLAQEDIRAHGVKGDLGAPILYRPFDRRYTYYTGRTRGFICMPRPEVMHHMLAGENVGLITVRQVAEGIFNHALVSRNIAESRTTLSNKGISYLFPLYLYPNAEGGPNKQADMAGLSPWPEGKDRRRPNLSPAFVAELERRLGLAFVPDGGGDLEKTFGPEDVLHYIYAVFHSSSYRERYAEFLKIDFPRVSLTSDAELFRALAHKGAELVALHLLESPAVHHHVTRYPIPGDNVIEPGHPRYLAPGEPEPGTGKPLTIGRVYISKDNPKTGKRGQYIEGVPPEAWEFQVGGYQICEKWLKDRRGRTLTNADLDHYECVVVALEETIRLMAEIDEAIEKHGGWPLS